jgi:hypothetical protein
VIGLEMHATVKGPLTDGRALRAHDEYVFDVSRYIAQRGAALVVSYSKSSFKNVTPYYWNQIRAVPAGGGAWDVDDGGVIYGPWLEGVGSRNRARPGFPGYHMFQRAGRVIDGMAGDMAEDRLRLYIPRMN